MSKSTADQAKEISKRTADKVNAKAADNGIVNFSGLGNGAFGALYLAFIPVTSYITKSDSIVEAATNLLIKFIPGGTVPANRTIPALAAIYLVFGFGITGAFSAAGLAMSRPEGLENNNPREYTHQLKGFPQRLKSAHMHLIENFSGWAAAAALTQTLEPGNQQLVNLLGLHILLKFFVHYPAYLLDVPPPRTLSHIAATATVINVCWRLALGA